MVYWLELFILNETAVVIINVTEDIFHFLGSFWAQATQLEKLFVAEGVRSCEDENRMQVRQGGYTYYTIYSTWIFD